MTHQALPEVRQRIRLLDMPQDPCPIEAGALGTVTCINHDPIHARHQIAVKWDNGRTLMLVAGTDVWEVVTEFRVVLNVDTAYDRYSVFVEATDPDQAAGIARELVDNEKVARLEHEVRLGNHAYVTDVIDDQGEECAFGAEHEFLAVSAPSAHRLAVAAEEVVRGIDLFDMHCQFAEKTDVGAAWELLHEWRKRLIDALGDDIRTAITADNEAIEDQLRKAQMDAEIVADPA